MKETEIKEKSIIMIEFLNGDCKPYYVNSKRIGNCTSATMLLGYLAEEIIKKAKESGVRSVWPIVDVGQTDRYYIQNNQKKGGDARVKKYRPLTEVEKKGLQIMLLKNGLKSMAASLN